MLTNFSTNVTTLAAKTCMVMENPLTLSQGRKGGKVVEQPVEEHHNQHLDLQQLLQLNCHSCVVHTLDRTCFHKTSGSKSKASQCVLSLAVLLTDDLEHSDDVVREGVEQEEE